MPWLLRFINEIIEQLPEDLNADVLQSGELEIATVELDEHIKLCWNKEKSSMVMACFSQCYSANFSYACGKKE
ncbi:MAG: hypothetical protein QRY74_06095 [Chlamydia sp.]